MAQAQEVFLFNPTQITGCQLWLDAADINGNATSVANGTGISSWKDKSSNGFTGTAVNSPTVQTNVLNRLPVVRFNGTNQYINFGNVLNLGTNGQSIFVVTKFDTTNESGIVGKTAYSAADQRWALWYGKVLVGSTVTGVQNIYQDNAQSGSSTVSTNPATIASQYNIYSYVTNRNNFLLNLNGSSASTATTTGAPSNFSTGFNLLVAAYADAGGINPRATMYMNGDIAEVLVYFTNLSTSQREQIEGYLAWKWGLQANLPATHPFKSYRPLGRTPFPTSIPPMPTIGQTNQVFAPTQFSGCQLWLDAADTSTVTGTNPVTLWRDKSGTGKTVTFVNTNTYTSGVSINTTSSAFFRVNVDFRKTAAPYVNMFIAHTWAGSSFNTQQALWGQDDGGGFNRIQFLSVPIDANAAYGLYYRSVAPYTLQAPSLNSGSRLLYSANLAYLISGGTFLGVNGTTTTTVTEGAASPETSTTSLGFASQNTTGGSIATINFHEIIIYISASSNISTIQRQQVEGYLAWKWGLVSSLPNGHPYKRNPIAPFPARSTAFRGGLNSWQPTQITGCQLWLDGNDPNATGSPPANGATISTWVDKSGNAKNATGGVSPTYSANGIQFNGTQYLTTTVAAGNNNASYFSVFNVNATTGPYVILGGNVLSTAVIYMNLSNLILGDWNNAIANNPTTISSSTRYLASGTAGSGILSLGINGGALTTGSSTFSGSGNFTIGAGYTDNRYKLSGAINEIIIYNSTLTTKQRQQVEGYLAWKWGLVGSLPANHPFKLFPPSP